MKALCTYENDAKNMRQFHNMIKYNLLDKIKYKLETKRSYLLDIGSGRGGDINKWDSLDIHNVIAVDINKFAVFEARDRYHKLQLQRNYNFFVTPMNYTIGRSLYSIGKHTIMFNVISCQFALHYFFGNINVIETFFKDISQKIVKDGYFIGTIVDGDSVMTLLNNHNSYENTAIRIQKFFDGPKYIGDFIKYALAGTLYFGEDLVSNEYLIFKSKLIHFAKKNDLELVSYKKFEDYDFAIKDSISSDYKTASYLNASFIFRKTN
jgi:mRNA (guanine-N7-)-methyltransferase